MSDVTPRLATHTDDQAWLELDEGDPLAVALEGFLARRLDAQPFAVTPASIRRTERPAGRTGFEIALA